MEGECASEWAYMDNDGLGLGTLYRWAKEDNIVEFNKCSDFIYHKGYILIILL